MSTDSFVDRARENAREGLWLANAVAAVGGAATAIGVVLGALPPGAVPVAAVATVPLGWGWWKSSRKASAALAQLAEADAEVAELKAEVVELKERYDRKYSVFASRWEYKPGVVDVNHWAARNIGQRKFVALKPIQFFTWVTLRRSDQDIPLDGAAVTRLVTTRSGGGDCIRHPFHSQTSSLQWRVEFDPPLRVGEEASLDYEIEIPQDRAATVAALRARPRAKHPPPGESEYAQMEPGYQMDNFVFEIVIPKVLGSSHHGMQVYRRDVLNRAEEQYLVDNDLHSVTSVTVNGEESWLLRIARSTPPIGLTYRHFWHLPN
ncbi:hypothetical protein KXR83_25835 [Williamsia muralis]|uniref:hypothetical protein n=1 Tax=Williamsia marianensis TaxID=85044 RepID=UPI003F168076